MMAKKMKKSHIGGSEELRTKQRSELQKKVVRNQNGHAAIGLARTPKCVQKWKYHNSGCLFLSFSVKHADCSFDLWPV
jgi:hypothetical protein